MDRGAYASTTGVPHCPFEYGRVTMWSVKYLPKPGAARMASRSAADLGEADGRTSNSDIAGLVPWGRGGWSAGADLDERGYREAARYLSAPYVDDDLVALLQARVELDERE